MRSPPRGFLAAVSLVSFSFESLSRSRPAEAACWNALVFDNHVGTYNSSAVAERRIL